MLEYKILTAEKTELLEKKLNKSVLDGWVISGDLVTSDIPRERFSILITRDIDNEKRTL